jgi:hypothetical protein
MTEDETRAELIDPKLRLSGWEMGDGRCESESQLSLKCQLHSFKCSLPVQIK